MGLKPREGEENDCYNYVDDWVNRMPRWDYSLVNYGCFVADSWRMLARGIYDYLSGAKGRSATGFRDVLVDPWQTNDIYNHLNLVVGAEGMNQQSITDIMKVADIYDTAKRRPWGPQELLDDFVAQAVGRLRNEALRTGDYEQLRRDLRKLLCQ